MQFYDYMTEWQRAKRLLGLHLPPHKIIDIMFPHLMLEHMEDIDGLLKAFDVKHIKHLVEFCPRFYGRYIHTTTVFRGGSAILDPFTASLAIAECVWTEDRRPFYNLWPSILPSLAKLDLSKADSSHFTLPLNRLLLRMPMRDNPFEFEDHGRTWRVQSVLCENTLLQKMPGAKGLTAGMPLASDYAQRSFSGETLPDSTLDLWSRTVTDVTNIPEGCVRGVCIWIDINEPLSAVRDVENGTVVPHAHHPLAPTTKTYRHFACEEGVTITESLAAQKHHASAGFGIRIPEDIVQDLFKVVATLCLFDADPEIVEPIVLAKDREKFEATHDQKYVEKAKARGNYGWDIGKRVEVSPHVRSASPAALYWTGPGRKIPRIRFRKGCLVKRHRMAEVPTGYLDDEEGKE